SICLSRMFYVHSLLLFFFLLPPPPSASLFPYTTLFRSQVHSIMAWLEFVRGAATLAGEYIDRAARRGCLNGFMVTLDELLTNGLHCHWTTERAISWQGVHRY